MPSQTTLVPRDRMLNVHHSASDHYTCRREAWGREGEREGEGGGGRGEGGGG